MTVLRLGKRRVSPADPTLLIAEIGSNHDNDLAVAQEMIDRSADAGWDAVKFQLFRAAWLYPSNCGVVDTPQGAVDFFDVLSKVEIAADWLPELKQYAVARGLQFLCTPFDEASVGVLDRLDVSGIKIASPEVNHIPLLKLAAKTGRPILCSSGLCTLGDLEEAIATIRAERADAGIALFHCVSCYPTPLDQANLGAIQTLHRAFGVPVGFSDHTMDYEVVPAVTVAVGGCLIEKHVTLGRHRAGPDHAFAIEPAEMRKMADVVRAYDAIPAGDRVDAARRQFGDRVQEIIGHGRKQIMPCEAEIYPCDKRSVHAFREIAAGEILSMDNIRVLRSERNLTPGFHPRYYESLLGARVVRAVRMGEGLNWEHLLSH